MADVNVMRNVYQFLTPYVAEIMQGAVILGIAGIAKMLTRRFAENEGDHKEILSHLAILNGRMGRAEVWQEEHSKAEERNEHNHDTTREQCQALHAERLAHLQESLGQRIEELWERIGDRRRQRRPTD